MRNEEPTVVQWVCQCCMLVLANGECCAETHDAEPMNKFDDIHATLGMLKEEHADECDGEGACDCERKDFSWSSCDGCGSILGGERHAVTGWIPKTEEK
jgi:hypothetical protein